MLTCCLVARGAGLAHVSNFNYLRITARTSQNKIANLVASHQRGCGLPNPLGRWAGGLQHGMFRCSSSRNLAPATADGAGHPHGQMDVCRHTFHTICDSGKLVHGGAANGPRRCAQQCSRATHNSALLAATSGGPGLPKRSRQSLRRHGWAIWSRSKTLAPAAFHIRLLSCGFRPAFHPGARVTHRQLTQRRWPRLSPPR